MCVCTSGSMCRNPRLHLCDVSPFQRQRCCCSAPLRPPQSPDSHPKCSPWRRRAHGKTCAASWTSGGPFQLFWDPAQQRLVCAEAYQVLVGEPRDLVLQTGFDPGLRRQLEVLSQELLLPVVLLFHSLQLASQRLHLHVVGSLLSLQLVLQQPWR